MNIITGEKFQNLCNHHISKNEHKKFELQVDNHIDVDTFDFTDFDNDELVYCNSSLVNSSKLKLIKSKLYKKLGQFKNPFELVLHNSDQNFGERQLKYLDISNCKKISSLSFLFSGIASMTTSELEISSMENVVVILFRVIFFSSIDIFPLFNCLSKLLSIFFMAKSNSL